MKIDAAVHFWKYEKSSAPLGIKNNKILQQHYLPEQLSPTLDRNGIDGCIAVAFVNQEVETRFLSELAKTHPLIKGVIGWTALHTPQSIEKIKELHRYGTIKGFRMRVDENSRPTPSVMEWFKEYGGTLELDFRPESDPAAGARFMETYPEQIFVLENAGNPATQGAPEKKWEQAVRLLAKHPQTHCKVSGLLSGGLDPKSWKPADLYPYLDILLDAFGMERLLFASDWPFILVAGMYVQWKSLLEKYLEKVLSEDREKFFGENARNLYRI
jgi:L-fuconolactonase